MTYSLGSEYRTTQTDLPAGDRGVRKTLGVMRSLALQGATQIEVRSNAIAALRMAGARPHDKEAEATALFEFVRNRVRYTSDPTTSEYVQAPRVTLAMMAGDCDDMAVLLASLLHSVGIPASFKVVATQPGNRNFSHVYVVAKLPDGRTLAMDPIYRSNVLGYEVPGASRSESMFL